MNRKNEIESKLAKARDYMRQNHLVALRLRGLDWFAWATAGGSCMVNMASEIGVGQILITENKAWVLTDRCEERRLVDEELSPELQIQAFPWEESESWNRFAWEVAPPEKTASDFPQGSEKKLGADALDLRLTLQNSEIERYRSLGRDAAQAMTQALAHIHPEMSERELAGEGAKQLWARGIHPTVVMVAGENRLPQYPHPIASSEKIGERVMMVFCGRRHGLYANLTRFRYFRDLTPTENKAHQDLMKIESVAWRASQPGTRLNEVFETVRSTYRELGREQEFNLLHMGGPTGYQAREKVARSQALDNRSLMIREDMALAWNPLLKGFKLEDTILTRPGRKPEILTVDPAWPTVEYDSCLRPLPQVKR